MLNLLHQLKTDNHISELSYQFAKLIDRASPSQGENEATHALAVLLAALLSHHVAQGHSCLDLHSAAARHPFGLTGEPLAAIWQKVGVTDPLVWQAQLQTHPAFSDDPNQVAPMLFQHGKLYLYRYWQSEYRIAQRINQSVRCQGENADEALHQSILDRFFSQKDEAIDWQKIAVATALKQRFCLISGGPGTGKTYTVAILLAALQSLQIAQQQSLLRIALTAPTGKAAARLKESISANVAKQNLPRQGIPNHASTIHSLIGIRPESDEPTFHSRHPLPFDLLVVDEASMIDLFVMEKLLHAMKPNSRMIILGDKDQLASVEAGNLMAAFGEFLKLGYSPAHSDYLAHTTGYRIPAQSTQVPAICDSLCHLRKSVRFGEESGIKRLADEINAKQAVRSWQQFTDPTFTDLTLIRYPEPQAFADKTQWTQHCVRLVIDHAVALYRDYLQAVKQRQHDPQSIHIGEIFQRFQQVRFLSALRVGEFGVERLNQSVAEALLRQGLVQFRHSRESYLGKPILITENVPALQIFSGDIGLILPDEQGKLRAYFDSTVDGVPHSVSLSRLPQNEVAYVMTVHKSQGSEFAHTLLVLPLQFSPVLSKELLYTAVTRARKHFTLFGSQAVWTYGVKTENQRQSGLSEWLREEREFNNSLAKS